MTISPASRALTALAGLCLVATGCSNDAGAYAARFNAPADLVAFSGVTKKNLGLHDYLAVASARGSDLVFVDPADDRAVLSPGAVFPISITTDPRPMRLAAASLGDRGVGGADLLVAVSAGSLDLQVVETWTAANRVVPTASVALSTLLGEGQILSVTAFTSPTASATAPRARLLAGVSGGRLVVVDFTRDATTGGVVPGTPVVKSIGVDAVAIAMEPGGTRAFLATPDPLPGSGATVHGVAWLDAGVDPAQPWTVGAIDALAPTRALAVAKVQERLVDPTNPSAQDTFDPVARLRIYAILDPAGCGADRVIGCGIAMLDDHGLLPDPTGALPFRAPLPVAGVASGIAIMLPPATGGARIVTDPANPGLPVMVVQPSNRFTTAVAAVTSSDGALYLYDLARFSPVNAGSALTTGVGVATAASFQPGDASIVGSPNYGKPMFLGFRDDFPSARSGAVTVVVNPASMRDYVQVTPGITPSDTFNVTWQGELPALATRRGVIGRAPTGETYVAIQANAGTTTQPSWVASVTVADPGLGVHAGDLVVLTPDDASLCATGDANVPYPELTVATDAPFLAPDAARFPGGAVKIAPGSCFEQKLATGQTATATITIRSAGLILASAQLGHLGRPVLDQTFVLSHQDESQVTGEALAVARKTRRIFYPTERACDLPAPPGCFPNRSSQNPNGFVTPNFALISNPLADGPFIGFRVGLYRIDTPDAVQDPTNPAVLALLPRGSRIILTTLTGAAATGFRPSNGGVIPGAVVSYDPTRVPLPGHENDGVHFYAAYRDDQVLDLTPLFLGGGVKSIR